MSKILQLSDYVKIAEQIHVKRGGAIGLWPLFNLVKWIDEVAGLEPRQMSLEIGHLAQQRLREISFSGEKTTDALSFMGVVALLRSERDALLGEIREAVLAARQG